MERLGNVLYWGFSLVAVVLGGYGLFILSTGPVSAALVVFVLMPAVVAWLTGLACRYVLAAGP